MDSEQTPETQVASTGFRARAASSNDDDDTANAMTASYALITTPAAHLDVSLPRISPTSTSTSNSNVFRPGASVAAGCSFASGGLSTSVALAVTPLACSLSSSDSMTTTNMSAPSKRFGVPRLQENSNQTCSDHSALVCNTSSTLPSPVAALNSALLANSIHSATKPSHSTPFSATNTKDSANSATSAAASTVGTTTTATTTPATASKASNQTDSSGSGGAGGGGGAHGGKKNATIPKFLRFLFDMLESEDHDVISWAHKGTAFQIRQPELLAAKILPKYFKHNKVSSFQRQLNYFGFKKWTKTQTTICTFSHPYFVRGDKEKMKLIRRKERSPHGKIDKVDGQPMQPIQQHTKKNAKDSATGSASSATRSDSQQRKAPAALVSNATIVSASATNKTKGKLMVSMPMDHSSMQIAALSKPGSARSRKRTALSMSITTSPNVNAILAHQPPSLAAFQQLQHLYQQPQIDNETEIPTRKRSSSGARLTPVKEDHHHHQQQHQHGLITSGQHRAGDFARQLVSDLDLHLVNDKPPGSNGLLSYAMESVSFANARGRGRDHDQSQNHDQPTDTTGLGVNTSVDQTDESFCNLPSSFADQRVDPHHAFSHFVTAAPMSSCASSSSSSTVSSSAAATVSSSSFGTVIKPHGGRDSHPLHHHSSGGGLLDHTSFYGSAAMTTPAHASYSGSSWGYTPSHPGSSSSDPSGFHTSMLGPPHGASSSGPDAHSTGNHGTTQDHGVPHEDYIDALLESTGFDSLSGHVNDASHLTTGAGPESHWRPDHHAHAHHATPHGVHSELHSNLFQHPPPPPHHHPFPATSATNLGRPNGHTNNNGGNNGHNTDFGEHGYGSEPFGNLQGESSVSAAANSSLSSSHGMASNGGDGPDALRFRAATGSTEPPAAISSAPTQHAMASSSSMASSTSTSSNACVNAPQVNYHCELTSFAMDPRKAPSY